MVHTPPAARFTGERRDTRGTGPGVPAKVAQKHSYDAAALLPDGSVIERRIAAPASPAFESAFAAFARGTLVTTPQGPVAVEDLSPGMEVVTREHGARPLVWIGAVTLPARPAARDGRPRLVRVMADAFGAGRPMPDILAGPAARLLRRDPGRTSNCLMPLSGLVDGQAVIPVCPPSPVRLFHLGLARHATITTAGLSMETFHPGADLESVLDADTLARFMALFRICAGPRISGPWPIRASPWAWRPRCRAWPERRAGAHACRLSRSSRMSKGTPGSSLAPRITSEVLTLATFSAAVSSSVRNFWKVDRSGATHLRMKSTSPLSMWHSRTSGQARQRASKAARSASAWLWRPTLAKT